MDHSEFLAAIRTSCNRLFSGEGFSLLGDGEARPGSSYVVFGCSSYRVKFVLDIYNYWMLVGPVSAAAEWQDAGWHSPGDIVRLAEDDRSVDVLAWQQPSSLSFDELIANCAEFLEDNHAVFVDFYRSDQYDANLRRLEELRRVLRVEFQRRHDELAVWRQKSADGMIARRLRDEVHAAIGVPALPSPGLFPPLRPGTVVPPECSGFLSEVGACFAFLFRDYDFVVVHCEATSDDISGPMFLVVAESADGRLKFVAIDKVPRSVTVAVGPRDAPSNWDRYWMTTEGWQHVTDVLDFLEQRPVMPEGGKKTLFESRRGGSLGELLGEQSHWLRPHVKEVLAVFHTNERDRLFRQYHSFHMSQIEILRTRHAAWVKKVTESQR